MQTRDVLTMYRAAVVHDKHLSDSYLISRYQDFFTNIFTHEKQILISLQYDYQPRHVLQHYVPISTRSALHTYSYGPAFMIPLQVLSDVLKENKI
jgi:hypothetical protein